MIQAATTSYAGLLVCRILVGIFEAGFVPAIALYMSFFYHRHEMGLRYGLFMACSPLANALASAIAYGVVTSHEDIEHWQLLFIIGKLAFSLSLSSFPVTVKVLTITFRRGNTYLDPCRCRLLLPSKRTFRESVPHRATKPNYWPAGNPRPGSRPREESQLQASLRGFQGLQELLPGGDYLLPQHRIWLSPSLPPHNSIPHGIHQDASRGILRHPLLRIPSLLHRRQFSLRPCPPTRHLYLLFRCPRRCRLHHTGTGRDKRGALLCHLPDLRGRLSRRLAHLHLGNRQPGLFLQARRRPGHLWHDRPVRSPAGRSSISLAGLAYVLQRHVDLRRRALRRLYTRSHPAPAAFSREHPPGPPARFL